jgi:hypothetical protein
MQKCAILLWSVMAERFLKFIPSEEAFWLIRNKPKAFYLLTCIANTARRKLGHPDGLLIGQCHLEHWSVYKFTQQEYRTAKQLLVDRKHIKIIETNRTRKKSTTGSTTKSTLVCLCSTTVYDINSEIINDRATTESTTEQRLNNDKQERIRMKKKEEEDHPSIPSKGSKPEKRDDGTIDDFSCEKEKIEVIEGVFLIQEQIDQCIKVKGDIEKVKQAMRAIQKNPKRKYKINDWPTAIANWAIDDEVKTRMKRNIEQTEKFCKEFVEYSDGHGWRCFMYNDHKKDQRGILFESQSPYNEAYFVALVDGELSQKCENFIKSKNMRKK